MQFFTLKLSIALFISFASENIIAQAKDINKIEPIPCFLVISDIHLDKDHSQNKIIQDDAGKDLWDTAKSKIGTIINTIQPKFIIVLGDLAPHNAPTFTVIASINTIRNQLKPLCPDSIPIFIVPGNNDSQNGDYKAFSEDNIQDNHDSPFLNRDINKTASLIDTTHVKDLGCYSVYPLKNKELRLIVLNTTIFTKNSNHPYDKNPKRQKDDADSQMTWLKEQLDLAKNEKVLIAMHIPPGKDGFYGNKLWNIDEGEIQEKFQKNIANNPNIIGLLASHSHMDGIRLLKKNDTVFSLLISVPGIAPGHGNNPGIKLISYDSKNFDLKDFTTYYMPYWNNSNEGSIKSWDSIYYFKKSFNDTGDDSMLQFLKKESMKKNNTILENNDSIYFVKSPKKESRYTRETIEIKQTGKK